MDFKIDADIPFPPRSGGKYPFSEMKPGESFLVSGDYRITANAAYLYGKLNNQKFSVRKTPEGWRCWRIA